MEYPNPPRHVNKKKELQTTSQFSMLLMMRFVLLDNVNSSHPVSHVGPLGLTSYLNYIKCMKYGAPSSIIYVLVVSIFSEFTLVMISQLKSNPVNNRKKNEVVTL